MHINKLKHRREKQLLLFLFPTLVQKAQLQIRKSNVRTRSHKKKNLKIKKPNTERFRRSIAYRGPKLWNLLSQEVQCCDNYLEFKNKIDKIYRTELENAVKQRQASQL